MSKTRKGSKMTKKGKVAKVSTKKVLGRGKNKRKTAKRGKVQCGGSRRTRAARRGVRSAIQKTHSGVTGMKNPFRNIKPFEKAKLISQIYSTKKRIEYIEKKIEETQNIMGKMETEEDNQTLKKALGVYQTELKQKEAKLEKLKTKLESGKTKTKSTRLVELTKFKDSEKERRSDNYKNDINRLMKLIEKKQTEMEDYFGTIREEYKKEFYQWFEHNKILDKLGENHRAFLKKLNNIIDPTSVYNSHEATSMANHSEVQVRGTGLSEFKRDMNNHTFLNKLNIIPSDTEFNTSTTTSPLHNGVEGEPAGETVEVGNLLGPYNVKPDVGDTNDEVKNDEVKNDPHNPFDFNNTQQLIPTPR